MVDGGGRLNGVSEQGRIAVLDLARGIAVLGILAVNVTTMAGPGVASSTPDWHGHARIWDWAAFIVMWLFFEGKMRAIFATLFGASLALFLARGDEDARLLEQVRRLLWLAIFGYLHFLLFWWGDILFTYAIAGAIALLFRELPPGRLLGLGAGMFLFVSLAAAAEIWWILDASHALVAGTAQPQDIRAVAAYEHDAMASDKAKLAEYAMGFWQAVRHRLAVMPAYPLSLASQAVFEALPLMLCGMGLARSGFFTGAWPRRAMLTMAIGGAAIGLGWYAALFAYEASQGFAPTPVRLLAFRLGLVGRFAMAASYLAIIVMVGKGVLRTRLGARIAAAGRMALSNYLGTTVVMTFLFHGWGLALVKQQYGHAALNGFVLLGWVLMLGWSRPWLAWAGIGPLEYAWRRLAGMGIRKAAQTSPVR